ncbi:MAG TPA: class I SAM-dependent methyltransferase [Chthoniobacterales bacterium]|nr:class I SAM-dependent methyltransferase [Chthoniobacterales bacterium]
MDRFIDSGVEQFAEVHTEPETDLYARLREETYREMDNPQMQVGLLEGRFLKMLVRLINAQNILEIGMFTGYSALMMAEGLPEDGHLITCDINPKAEAIARKYFTESPHGKKIDIRMGPALETIKTLSNQQFDLVFIDADKPNYCNYYEACFPLVKPGGLIIGDNVLWSGKVVDPQDDNTRAIVAFTDLVQSDSRVDNVCLTIRDGILLAWKRPAAR